MSDRYGKEIGSRSEFRRVLSQTLRSAKQLAAETPEFGPYISIANQLAAISKWTSGGRLPTSGERESLTLGITAVRELEDNSEPAIRDFCHRIYEICDYLDRMV
jgi:hypothetical protein